MGTIHFGNFICGRNQRLSAVWNMIVCVFYLSSFLRFKFHVGRVSRFPLPTNGSTQLFHKFTINTLADVVMPFF